MATGSISYDEFSNLIGSFIDVSAKIDDGWYLEHGSTGTPYIRKRWVQHYHVPEAESKLPAAGQALPESQGPESNNIPQRFNEKSPPSQGAVSFPESSPPLTSSSPLSERAGSAGQSSNSTILSPLQDGAGGRMEPDAENVLQDMEIESEEDACLMPSQTPASSSTRQTLTYEYHIVYSESYSVPVLYFNIFTTDGKLLPLEEVWNLSPKCYQDYLTENKWTTLTQQEHPVLGRPFLQLHPCHTADLMAQVLHGQDESISRRNYLVTWLSTVGPLVGLSIPSAYISQDL